MATRHLRDEGSHPDELTIEAAGEFSPLGEALNGPASAIGLHGNGGLLMITQAGPNGDRHNVTQQHDLIWKITKPCSPDLSAPIDRHAVHS